MKWRINAIKDYKMRHLSIGRVKQNMKSKRKIIRCIENKECAPAGAQ